MELSKNEIVKLLEKSFERFNIDDDLDELREHICSHGDETLLNSIDRIIKTVDEDFELLDKSLKFIKNLEN